MTITPIFANLPITIQFYDVDPMNVVWHGNYPRFFEAARSALLDLLSYNYPDMEKSGYLWPIVDLHIKYIRPLTLLQKILVEATLVEYENRLIIEYCIRDESTGQLLTKGKSTQVALNAQTHELQFETPEVLRQAVHRFTSSLEGKDT